MHGISIFPGMGYPLEDSLKYLEEASKRGFTRVFTSLHIPEADSALEYEAEAIAEKAASLGMELTADVSKGYMKKAESIGLKLHALRLDFGFSPEEIAELSNRDSFRIQLNASVLDERSLDRLLSIGLDPGNVEVCHNYYPRRDTGISWEFLNKRNDFFHTLGMKTMAFIPSLSGRRGPLFEGLPTVEAHRDIPPLVSAQHLMKGGTDLVLFGDAIASLEELDSLSGIRPDVARVPIRLLADEADASALLSGVHHNRLDPADYVIRSEESRLNKKSKVSPSNCIKRAAYSVTIDNNGYGRYEGELQIVKKDLPADPRVNVLGSSLYGRLLIDMLGPGDAFEFHILKDRM
ncbi:MupG family TIM beta-alpha barrel fold protein [Youngiibacter fragilis]|uniref:Cell surface protein n=1 Tax=Youngiibacter fragilis 232.1 TaxID=994573 RepID=V7I739_9CLOT|nr:MupG family TIM beta-alpha barrel fold protein [Youngiibacter fragilis]ETA81039.1 hypothetical protein T472_0208740 [Youngiibacter fragilis 232.1]